MHSDTNCVHIRLSIHTSYHVCHLQLWQQSFLTSCVCVITPCASLVSTSVCLIATYVCLVAACVGRPGVVQHPGPGCGDQQVVQRAEKG